MQTRARGRRHAGRGHDVLGERLAALELGGGGGRAEAGDAGGPDGVGHPGDQRRLGADHDQVGLQLRRQRGHRGAVGGIDAALLGDRGRAGVAGRADQRGDRGIGGQRQAEGVLAGTGTDDEDAHSRRAYGAVTGSGEQRTEQSSTALPGWATTRAAVDHRDHRVEAGLDGDRTPESPHRLE